MENTSTVKDLRVDEMALDEEESETLHREEKEGMTPIGNVQHRRDISAKTSVQDRAPKEDSKDDIPARDEHVNCMSHIKYFRAQKSPIGKDLTILNTLKNGNDGHYTPNGDSYNNLNREKDDISTSVGERLSIHGRRNEGPMSLTSKEGGRKYSPILK